ncbi:MAG TPA: DNA-processing protein DprA [Desulfomonilaceae bacterium]|nr:DNA-processing protein DprA [Desulfomonilaceae bacterium]
MASQISSDDSVLFDWLALERIPRVGPLTMARLYNAFGSPRAAMEADPSRIRRLTGLNDQLARAISGFAAPRDEILRDLEMLKRLGARIITRWDPDYPPNLKEIYDPPALLFVRGQINSEDSRAVAVVGTRNPTRYGIEMTEQISKALVQAGITLISGLARGIDTACHQTAIKEQGRTIGVLGCGIDVSYPKENKKLIQEIAQSGAVISEFRPATAPLATNFYRRNRIVSGLAKAVLVVEATRNSGSLITANHAVEQNRDVFAVPGNVMNPRSHGCHHLIKQGAGLIESADDIIASLFPPHELNVQETLFEPKDSGEALSEISQTILEALDPDPVPIDVVCENLRMDAGKVAGVLLELELSGMVRQHPGKMFSRVLK